MKQHATGKIIALHLGLIVLLFCLQFILPAYHQTNVARIMVLASFAIGYNILLGYTGLMSLGHAMFFAAGMYGAGLGIYYSEWTAIQGLAAGIVGSACLAALFGLVALRTSGVSFLIVTMMFAQACYLTILYFNEITLGDQGFTLSNTLAPLNLGNSQIPFSDPALKFNGAWVIFSGCLLLSVALVTSPIGRVFIAIRENEERARLLGYNTFAYKLLAITLSGGIAGAAGATYAILFSYVGASFAAILYSIYPLLWTLLGGAGTTLGPLVGAGFMFYAIDFTSELTSSYLFVVGGSLLVLILWFPKGMIGSLRDRWLKWLP